MCCRISKVLSFLHFHSSCFHFGIFWSLPIILETFVFDKDSLLKMRYMVGKKTVISETTEGWWTILGGLDRWNDSPSCWKDLYNIRSLGGPRNHVTPVSKSTWCHRLPDRDYTTPLFVSSGNSESCHLDCGPTIPLHHNLCSVLPHSKQTELHGISPISFWVKMLSGQCQPLLMTEWNFSIF